MGMSTLRSNIIRLASEHPEFRKDLLPLLGGKTATGAKLPPELDALIKPMVQDAIDEVELDYEGYNTKLVEPQGHGYMFGSGTDGGYGGETLTNLSSMSGAGRWPRNPVLSVPMQKAENDAHEAAVSDWIDSNADFMATNGLSKEQVSYSDLYDLGFGSEAESLSEAEQEYYNDEDIAFRIAVFYFAPGGYNNKEQRIEVTAVADCEGRYLPSDKLLSTFDETIPFKNVRDLKPKLAQALKKAVQSLK